jgi:hypothetical protein
LAFEAVNTKAVPWNPCICNLFSKQPYYGKQSSWNLKMVCVCSLSILLIMTEQELRISSGIY